MNDRIIIQGASENNLKNISVEIPHNTITVVTGISGSGKSSLVYDVIYKESRRRYLETFSGYSKKYFGKLQKPDVISISGLKPSVSVDQNTVIRTSRSTVGTLSGIYDYLRLLFARFAVCTDPLVLINPDRSLFSFNSVHGACPSCKGLGVTEKIDPDKLISDPNLALSEGALVITAPNGYIIYSQVTMEVLNRVLNAHGFHVDIPWNKLTDEQKNIVLYGSDIITVPFGKHTLESRMKWTGITAKPREEGHYKGIIPVMDEILKRDRNENILRFVSSEKCHACDGTKLRKEALTFYINGKNIAEVSALTIENCLDFFKHLPGVNFSNHAMAEVVNAIVQRASIMKKSGIGYLTVDRESVTLSRGEAQRVRLATQVGCGLGNMIYVLDEPSVGLHARDSKKLMEVLLDVKKSGNTLLVVEHDDDVISYADYLVDMGPGAGKNGGEVLFAGYTDNISAKSPQGIRSSTFDFLFHRERINIPSERRTGRGNIVLSGACKNNLKNITVTIKAGAFNVITGVSGAGKSSLAEELVQRYREDRLESPVPVDKIIEVDQSPIGRSLKSNPATYTGMFDFIRDLFAAQPGAESRKFGKGRFSFNNKGGRCESCEGAGMVSVGMHFMGDVDIVCETCNGRRFNDETLQVTYKGKNIFQVLEMTVDEAAVFFIEHPKITRYLKTLVDTGLGYISLGQPSPSLSGGEAQRVKLATELARPEGKHTLYILDEPSAGLHTADLEVLLSSLNRLVDKGHTLVVIEHNLHIINSADHVIDLGPESAVNGGFVVFEGTPVELAGCRESFTGIELKKSADSKGFEFNNHGHMQLQRPGAISFQGVVTNNLKNISLEIPENKITVFTGLSGSGKSSLLIDTVYAECRQRFIENFPAWVRAHISKPEKPDFGTCSGLMPAVYIGNVNYSDNPRSTLGTVSELYDYFRLLYARAGKRKNNKNPGNLLSSFFSFNHESGACMHCKGIGRIITCDVDKLVSNPEKPLVGGAMNKTKTGMFYGDIHGQYIWTLQAVGCKMNIDFSKPWNELDEEEKHVAMYGAGDTEFDVVWKYKRKNAEGEHRFRTIWPGFVSHVNDEYLRKHADNRGAGMLHIMKHVICPSCQGKRLGKGPLEFTFAGIDIAGLCDMDISGTVRFFLSLGQNPGAYGLSQEEVQLTKELRDEIVHKLQFFEDAGLGYLSLSRHFGSLSGGESGRAALAGMVQSGLTGLLYILDEPTTGLHPADTKMLIKLITRLKNEGNTMAIIEHDPDIIRCADHVIDIGPGAGKSGGAIVATGTLDEVIACNTSVTGKYLGKHFKFMEKTGKRLPENGFITVKGASANNLKQTDAAFPTGCFSVVTGVSGSGKTSLVFDVLHQSILNKKPVASESVTGYELFDSVAATGQHEIFLSRSGNIATICNFFDEIRNLFAATGTAMAKKFDKSFFSFNHAGGRCETCLGNGRVKVNLDFFSDMWVECETCHGERFKKEILTCMLNGLSVTDVLRLTVFESLDFFKTNKKISAILKILDECGLGYLQLGQPADTLSRGEAQRLKLAGELAATKGNRTLYLFDEPTTGLHFRDIENLLALFGKLIDSGHTIIAVEHNVQLIKSADYIIEIGPGAGTDGGDVIAKGTPAEIMRNPCSILKGFLS